MYLIQGSKLLSLLVDYIGMFSELFTYLLQYGCLSFLTGCQLGKYKVFQLLANSIEANGYRICRSYHRIQLFFLVVSDEADYIILPFVYLRQFRFYGFRYFRWGGYTLYQYRQMPIGLFPLFFSEQRLQSLSISFFVCRSIPMVVSVDILLVLSIIITFL